MVCTGVERDVRNRCISGDAAAAAYVSHPERAAADAGLFLNVVGTRPKGSDWRGRVNNRKGQELF